MNKVAEMHVWWQSPNPVISKEYRHTPELRVTERYTSKPGSERTSTIRWFYFKQPSQWEMVPIKKPTQDIVSNLVTFTKCLYWGGWGGDNDAVNGDDVYTFWWSSPSKQTYMLIHKNHGLHHLQNNILCGFGWNNDTPTKITSQWLEDIKPAVELLYKQDIVQSSPLAHIYILFVV